MTSDTPVFTRPNGKTYRPRKPPRAMVCCGEDECGVMVLGTHDAMGYAGLALGQAKSCCDASGVAAGLPGWWRLGYLNGELGWIEDEVRGAPGIYYRSLQ